MYCTQEVKAAKELFDWDNKIGARTKELAMATAENTRYLNTISDLTKIQISTEQMLTVSQTWLLTDQVTNSRLQVVQREELVKLVNNQAKRVEELKNKILKLKRKDTNLYS